MSTLESALAKQEEILVAAQEEMQEKILAADERSVVRSILRFDIFPNLLVSRYAGLRSVNIHLEGNILELQERWVRNQKMRRAPSLFVFPGKRGKTSREERGKSKQRVP